MNLNEGRDDWAELLAELQAEEAPSALEEEETLGIRASLAVVLAWWFCGPCWSLPDQLAG